MFLRPIGDKVIIRRLNHSRQIGNILLPDVAIPKSQEGIVVAVGPGDRDSKGRLVPIDLVIGDRVMFGKHSGKSFNDPATDQEFWMMRESELICKVENVTKPTSTDS